MLIRLAALGALGYFGLKQYRKMQEEQDSDRARQTAVAGGPLSAQATIQRNPDMPPAEAWNGASTSSA